MNFVAAAFIELKSNAFLSGGFQLSVNRFYAFPVISHRVVSAGNYKHRKAFLDIYEPSAAVGKKIQLHKVMHRGNGKNKVAVFILTVFSYNFSVRSYPFVF